MNKPPVLLVASLSQAPRQALVQAMMRQLGGAIAWLDNPDWPASLAGPLPTHSFMACACCSGAVVLATHLARMVRNRQPDTVIISLSARAEPRKVLQLLSADPWRAALGPVRLISVIDERSDAVLAQPGHALHDIACQQRDLAWRVLRPDDVLPQGFLASE